jgi:hypothetical protein
VAERSSGLARVWEVRRQQAQEATAPTVEGDSSIAGPGQGQGQDQDEDMGVQRIEATAAVDGTVDGTSTAKDTQAVPPAQNVPAA